MIRAVALDVDGVLTDGRFYWGADGAEYKCFSFRDVMGISLATKSGIVFALISGEESPQVDMFAQKMAILDVYKGCKDKAVAVREFALNHGLQNGEICFVGDDVNDLPAFAEVGFAAAPCDAHPDVIAAANYVARASAGNGAVREVLDHLMATARPSTIEG